MFSCSALNAEEKRSLLFLLDRQTEVGELLTKAFSTSNEEGVDSRRAEVSTRTFNPLYQFPGTLKGDISDSRKRKKAKEERGSEGERGRGEKGG